MTAARLGKVGTGGAAGALLAAALGMGMLTGGAAQGADYFTDVPASHPQRDAILFAAGRGWFQGYPDGTFRPDREVAEHQLATVVRRAFPEGASRADLAAFMRAGARTLDDPPSAGEGCGWPVFSDVGETHPRHWDVKYASDYGWFQGYPDGTFRPDRTVTAARTSLVLRRAFPEGASRADLATFMREGSRALDGNNRDTSSAVGDFLAFDIAFRHRQDDGYWISRDELWVTAPDGSEPRQLVEDADQWQWSPDGRTLAYTVESEGMYGNDGLEVWAMDAETGRVRMLSEHSPSSIFSFLLWRENLLTLDVGGDRTGLWVYEGAELKPRRLTDDGRQFLTSNGEGDLKYETALRDAAGEWAGAEFWSYDLRTGRTRRVGDASDLSEHEFSPGDKCAVYKNRVADQQSPSVGLTGAAGAGAAATVPALHIPGGYSSSAYPPTLAPPLPLVLTELWVKAFDGSPPRRLSDAPDYLDRYQWSPDGAWIAYQVEVTERGSRTGQVELWAVAADGSAPARKVADDVGLSYGYGWSPDGKHLAYQSPVYDENGDWLGAYDAWVVDVETFAQTRLFADGPGERRFHTGFGWRRDGQGIDFGVNIRDEDGYVTASEHWTADADGSNQRRTTPLFLSAVKLKTSPDGTRAAYVTEVRNEAGIWQSEELWTADADETNRRRLADGLGDVQLMKWAPDGNNIAYKTRVRDETGRWVGEELWVAAADGSALRRQAAAENITRFLWSRTGRWLAYQPGDFAEMWFTNAEGTETRLAQANDSNNWRWN